MNSSLLNNYDTARDACDVLCARNNFDEPDYSLNDAMRPMGRFNPPNLIEINLTRCTLAPPLSIGLDRSPAATVYHEFGHYINHAMGWNNYAKLWLANTDRTLTLYGTKNVHESIAESFMVFMLKPSYLRATLSSHYEFFHDTLNRRREQ